MPVIPTMDPAAFSEFVRSRRSCRDFEAKDVDEALLREVLDDAKWAPSWCNTSPYHIVMARGAQKDRIKEKLLAKYDAAMAAKGVFGKLGLWLTGGAPDGDYDNQLSYTPELNVHRKACGFGLYDLLGIKKDDMAARNEQVRKNFEFFGAPVVFFVFVQGDMGVFSPLDAGFYLQNLLLSAHARGLATCAQGALATWKSPIVEEFPIPKGYKLICGVSMGYASSHVINTFNPGRRDVNGISFKQDAPSKT